MPNHVSNRIYFERPDEKDFYDENEEAIEKLRTLMKTENRDFDFNVLIPYPKVWAGMDKAYQEAEDEYFKAMKTAKEANVPFTQSRADLPKDGYNQGGYEWCIEHWGTKWNAYKVAYNDDCVYFDTAWSTPRPIWVELSKRFPNLNLMVEFADEDIGRNCGILVYCNGEIIEDAVKIVEDPELFARAIVAEAHSANCYQELHETRQRIKELEAQLGIGD